MSDQMETPPQQIHTPRQGESMDQYRISILEISTEKLIRRMDKWFDHWEETYRKDTNAFRESLIECARHGRDIETLKNEKRDENAVLHKRITQLQSVKTNRATLWASIAALASGIGAVLTGIFKGGS